MGLALGFEQNVVDFTRGDDGREVSRPASLTLDDWRLSHARSWPSRMRRLRFPSTSAGSSFGHVLCRVHVHVEVKRRSGSRAVGRRWIRVLVVGVATGLLMLLLLLRVQGWRREWTEVGARNRVLGYGMESRVPRCDCWRYKRSEGHVVVLVQATMLVKEGARARLHVLGHIMTRIALQFEAVWCGRDNVWRTIHVLRHLLMAPLLNLAEVLHVQCGRHLEGFCAKVMQRASRSHDLAVRPVEGREVAHIEVTDVAYIANVEEV